jgi:hypothetical protein
MLLPSRYYVGPDGGRQFTGAPVVSMDPRRDKAGEPPGRPGNVTPRLDVLRRRGTSCHPVRTPAPYELRWSAVEIQTSLVWPYQAVVHRHRGSVPRPGGRQVADRAAVRAAPPGHHRGPAAARRSARAQPPAGRRAQGVPAHGDHRVRPAGGRGLRRGTRRRRQRGGLRVPGAAQRGGPGVGPSPQPQVRGLVPVLPAAALRLPVRPAAGPARPRAVPGRAVAPARGGRGRLGSCVVRRSGREDQAAAGHRRLGGPVAFGDGPRRHGRGHLRRPTRH